MASATMLGWQNLVSKAVTASDQESSGVGSFLVGMRIHSAMTSSLQVAARSLVQKDRR